MHSVHGSTQRANGAASPCASSCLGGFFFGRGEPSLALRFGEDHHGLSGVQDRNYNKGLHLPAKTHALHRWNDFIADLPSGAVDEGNVYQLPTAMTA